MTAEAILRLLNDPVLPFYPLDIALDVQNKLKGIIVIFKCYVIRLLRWVSSGGSQGKLTGENRW